MTYWDLRREKILGERFYIDQGHMNRYLMINKEGYSHRLVDQNSFLIVPSLNMLGVNHFSPTSDFDSFVRKVWSDQVKERDDFRVAQGVNVPEELKRVAESYDDKSLSFRFTWETREQTFENSLGFIRRKVEYVRVVRIDLKTDHIKGHALHLRIILDNPTAQKIASEVDTMYDHLEDLKESQNYISTQTKVLMNPNVASVFVHEVVGHWAEQIHSKDHYLSVAGKKIAPEEVSIIEDAHDPERMYQAPWDDEGIDMKTFDILHRGIVCQPITSFEKAFQLGVKPQGRGRAQDFRFGPLSRMANIHLLPGTATFDDLIADIEDGYYVVGSLGGLNSKDLFQIQTQYAYRVVRGKIQERTKGPLIMGNVSNALSQILGVGNRSEWTPDGGCFGKGQFLELSGRGAPFLLMNQLMVL